MAYFYKLDGEIFIPEKINPDLVRLANGIIKSCKLNFKLQLKSTSIANAMKSGKKEQMLSIMQKCFNVNKKIYDQDMALTGVTICEVEDSFFEDKDVEFFLSQLKVLSDFAVINTVIDSKLMRVLSASCEKALGTPIDKIKFFTNQEKILEVDDEDEEVEE